MNKLDLITICKLRDQFMFRPNERQAIVDSLGFHPYNHVQFALRLEAMVPRDSPLFLEYVQLIEKIPVPLSALTSF